jgi:hypothetical protein
MNPVTLPQLTRGDHSPEHTFTLSRAAPALDLEAEGTTIRFMARRKGQTTLWLAKTVGDGVTVTSATTCTVQLAPADTASLPTAVLGTHLLEWELEVTESDGRVTTPAWGTLQIRGDIG